MSQSEFCVVNREALESGSETEDSNVPDSLAAAIQFQVGNISHQGCIIQSTVGLLPHFLVLWMYYTSKGTV